jgi:anti-sigma factor RsiW
MPPDGTARDDVRCIELVELLNGYLDDELAEEQRQRVDAHLAGCRGCSAALDQFRTLIHIAGRLTAAEVASLDPMIRDRLITTLQTPRRR